MKQIALAILVALLMLFSASVGAEDASIGQVSDEPVLLCVFLYDRCGGCGVDSPGCGNCQDIVTYHGIIRDQLGDRLYDGTIYYRMLNCRMEANDAMYDEFYAAYGVNPALYGHLPTVFIGSESGGVYMVGESELEHVGEAMDAYMRGDAPEDIQAEIDGRRAG